jgi:hypothetical protein
MNKSIKHKLVYDIWITRSRNNRVLKSFNLSRNLFKKSKTVCDKLSTLFKLQHLRSALKDTPEYKDLKMSEKLISELNEKAKLLL